jgi:hypothetical protein
VPESSDPIETTVNAMFAESAPTGAPTEATPEVTQGVSDAPAEGQVEQQEAAPLSVEDRLKEFGINDVSELEVWQQERSQKAELERELEFMRMQAKVAAYQTQQQAPVPQTQPEDPLRAFSPPEYDPAWDARYAEGKNEDGSIKWKADAPVEVRLKREQLEAFRDQFANNFLADPRKNFIEPLLEQAKTQARQEALEVFRTEQAAMQTQHTIDKVLSDNADWIYAKDGKTFSAAGAQFEQFYIQAQNAGVANVQDALDIAMDRYIAKHGDPKRPTIKNQIQQNRIAAQNPAGHVPQRNGQQLPRETAPRLNADNPDAWEDELLASLGLTR